MGFLVVGVSVLVIRYAPLIEDVRAAREAAIALSSRLAAVGPGDLDGAALDRLRTELHALEGHVEPLGDLMSGDPLVAFLRVLPAVDTQVTGAEALVAAVGDLVEAGDLGLDLADGLVSLQEVAQADPSVPLLPGLVGLMARSTEDVDRIATHAAAARARVETLPAGVLPAIREAGELVAGPLARYAPLLDAYRELDDTLPGVLGWGGERRYLILAQNPAELRPTGGYSGTIGVVTLRDGAIVEQRFRDVHELDRIEGLPFVDPPDELAEHLLGEDQSWRLADANWSADFPTAAQEALRHYRLEAGDGDIDGVVAITTFALDRLLQVVGPVSVDEHGLTVEPGATTLALLEATRGGPREGRKDVLDVLAREVMARLLRTPPDRWPVMHAALMEIIEQRMALAWFVDPKAQRLALEAGLAGSVHQGPGDYVFVVEANLAPTSKYNLVIDRAASLVVRLDEDGDALTSLRLDWQNDADAPGEPYRSLREFSFNQEGHYGAYLRLLVPDGSRLLAVRGAAAEDIRAPERVMSEAGRTVFANYLLMVPGASTLTYLWEAPGVVSRTSDGGEYRLFIQKQPGARPGPLRVRIHVPEGASITDASPQAELHEDRAVFELDTRTDVEIAVRYVVGDAPS